jgi:hypothetical protein
LELRYLRSSSANTFKDCEFQYFLEYVLGIQSPSGKKAVLGTICHLVLEIMAKHKRNGRAPDKYCDPEYLLRICWDRITKEETHIQFDEKKDYRFCEKTLEKAIVSKYNPLKLKIMDPERQFVLPLEDPRFTTTYHDLLNKTKETIQIEIRGTIDLVCHKNADTLHIVDYKTGKRKCWITGEEKDDSFIQDKDVQARIYALAASRLYPKYKKIIVTIYYINDGGAVSGTFTKKDHAETYNILKDIIDEIKSNQFPSRIKEERPKDTWKCKYVCPFGERESNKLSNGVSVCNNIYGYMVQHGINDTIRKVNEKKQQQKSKGQVKDVRASNRRNIYDDETSEG